MVEKKDIVVNLDWTKEFGPAWQATIVNGKLKEFQSPRGFSTTDYEFLVEMKKVIEDVIKVIEREKR